MELNAERWTVIATKPSNENSPVIRWRYEPGFNARNVAVAVDGKRLLVAHKRVDGGWHLVAKLPKS
jgi:hypothetical protein